MAGFNYQRGKSTADRLIDKFGTKQKRNARFIKSVNSGSAFDPKWEDVETPATVVDIGFDADDDDFTKIKKTDLKLIVKAEVDVENSNAVLIDGIRYTINNYRKVSPGDVVLLYKVHLTT